MAINPVSSSLPFVDTALPAAGPATSSTSTQATQPASTPSAITTDQLAEMEAAAIDPDLIGNASGLNNSVSNSFSTMLGGDGTSSGDPLLDALNGVSSTSTTSSDDPLLDASTGTSASSGSTGDPLLDALNTEDANSLASGSASSGSAGGPLNSSPTSFFSQQASASYLNAQAMDNLAPGSGTDLTSA
jgi:hypothetical protein